jgi:hypothetical protein
MFPELDQPLTNEQINALKEAQKLIPKLKDELRRAKLAGLDVTQQEADLSELEGRVQGLLRVYGASGRSRTTT